LRTDATGEDGRIALIQSDIWIGFPRAEQVLGRLQSLIEAPRQTRMPGLLVHGASGIGKTMIARNLSRRHAPEYDPELGITCTPLLLLQAPPAPDERRFYLHILAAVGAPATALSLRAQSVASLEVRVVSLLRDLGLRMIMIDEVHNLLAGTHREQRRFLNVLRYLSNELEASLVCFGVSEAVDAIRGDVQLARRLDEHHLPNWRDDVESSDMIQTLIAAMPLVKKSNLKVKSLKQILALTGGVTSRIFALVKDMSIDATYRRFAMSTAVVEDLLATRGVIVSREAVRQWVNRFGRHFANCIRRGRPRPNDKCHFDEVVISIRGKRHRMRRAIDANRDVLDFLVQTRRNAKVAKRFLSRLIALFGASGVVITDKLQLHQAFQDADTERGSGCPQRSRQCDRGVAQADTQAGEDVWPIQIPPIGTEASICV